MPSISSLENLGDKTSAKPDNLDADDSRLDIDIKNEVKEL